MRHRLRRIYAMLVRMILRRLPSWILAGVVLALLTAPCGAQNNYEIQVYGSETVPPKTTMVELHSNFTFQGEKEVVQGVYPSIHALHETVEITQGITPWFETGFYIFTAATSAHGWEWVGDHIRPRVRVPDSWHWPVGVSMSTEFGYARPVYSSGTWTIELRPIVDQQKGRLYWAVNPAFDKSFAGPDSVNGWAFEPAAKISWNFSKAVAFGLEYYGGFGPVSSPDPFHYQSQQFVPAFDLDIWRKWEINFGLGVGVSAGTDHMIFKTIIGRRFEWGHPHPEQPIPRPQPQQ
jgi:hypothetical protein